MSDSVQPTQAFPNPTESVTSDGTVSSESLPTSGATVLGGSRYLLGEEIARGGMGEVYRATDTVLNREVAVKVLQAKYGPESGSAHRFADEARITSQLQHPGIPPVHDLGTLADGRPFLAMKLIKGETLDNLIKQKAPINTLAVVEAICQALAYAHAHEVIHRDLKPANIMVGAFGEVQVMDWGLAKVLTTSPSRGGESTESDSEATKALTEIKNSRTVEDHYTQDGDVLGTPAYMSPEQAIGAIHRVDQRSDVFGLGGILAAMITGKPPYVSDSAIETRFMAAEGQIQPCLERLEDSEADPELVILCKRCLNPKREERFASATQVAKQVAELRTAAEERARQAELETIRVEVTIKEQSKRRRLTYTGGSLVLLTFLVGTIVALVYASEANRNSDRAETNEKLATKRAKDIEAEQGLTKNALQKVQAEQENTQQLLAYSKLLLAEATWHGSGTAKRALEQVSQIPERFHNWEHYHLKRKYQACMGIQVG
jgi:serine/threonine protein kinase